MNNRNTNLIIGIIGLLVFNTCFFLIKPDSVNLAVYMAYFFVNLSIVGYIVSPFIEDSNREVSLKLSTAAIAIVYITTTLILCIIMIVVNPEEAKYLIAGELVLLGIFVGVIVTNITINNRVVKKQESTDDGIAFVKRTSSVLKVLIDDCNDEAIRVELQKLYDIVYSSQIAADSRVYPMEAEIEMKVKGLQSYIRKSEQSIVLEEIETIRKLAQRRNVIAKYSN